jgi:hypothetical protein
MIIVVLKNGRILHLWSYWRTILQTQQSLDGFFEEAFNKYYTTIHRYETNRLRNIAGFFGHLFGTHSISWMVMVDCIKINEDDTTSSSRIFVKIMMQDMMPVEVWA